MVRRRAIARRPRMLASLSAMELEEADMRFSRTFLGKRPARVLALALVLTGIIGGAAVSPVAAGIFDGGPLKKILGNASDNALDKLAKPGAFYADSAVRILLPGAKGKLASKIFGAGDKLGLTNKLTQSLNDAAGLAALEAKPIFRSAVDNMTLADVPELATKSDGATQFLKKSAGAELRTKIKPLVTAALTKVGAYKQLDQLGKAGGLLQLAGVNKDGLTDSVTDQTMSGIYNYMGKEEAGLRGNTLGKVGSVLGGIIK